MSSTRKYKIHILTALAILSFSTFIPALAYAAPLAVSEKEWQNMNGDTWARNYSPANQINKDNVENLEVKWLFALESVITHGPQGYTSLSPGDGSSTPPLVVDGVVYIATNYQRIYALDAKTGKELWAHGYDVDIDELAERLPLRLQSFGYVHNHGFRYWEGGNALINRGIACDFYGVDATTGETSFWLKDLCADVEGNIYTYSTVYGGAKQGSIGVYEKGRQFIYVLSGAMHSTAFDGDGRHVTMGIDIDTHQTLWRVYGYPPQDRPTKDWALQECDIGFFMDIPCSEVAAAAPENLEWDWAQPNEPPNIFGGVTGNWGQLVMDEDTGIIYTNTGNQGPYTYVGATPGPRLYGSTIMAIDVNKGKLVWWLQPFPRDPYDYDCNWSGILAEDPTLGKVYMKGCKEGRLYVMDAATGKPHYVVDLVDEMYGWGQITRAGTLEPPEGGIKYHLNDPFSYYDMREMKSPDNSRYCGRPCPVFPSWSNGIFATDMSYDPETSTLYHYAKALQTTILESPAPIVGENVRVSRTSGYPIVNTTVVARDVATGNVKWTWYYDYSGHRSHLVVTKELVFTGFTDGYVRFFDKNTGELLHEMNLGAHMLNGFTTGQDSDGNQKIFAVVGVGRVFPTVYPRTTQGGVLVALGLSERAAQVRTTTVTTTATTRLTTTTTSATTLTTTSSTTVTTTAPAQTVTTTQSVTEEVGLPATITYAAVAVAVIAIIAAAVLATRRRP